MNRIQKAILGAIAISMLNGHLARAGTYPATNDQLTPFSDFANTREGVGSDGNERFIWDIFAGDSYTGSTLWILDAQGQVVGAGNASIPPVGTGLISSKLSNIALHVYSNTNNSQLAFADYDPVQKQVTRFATWTYNSQGQLIGAAGWFGPFRDVQIENLSFHTGGLVVKWLFPNGANVVWYLDQYGAIASVAGPFGPFAGAKLGIVTIDSPTPNQLWHWIVTGPGGSYGLNTWSVNPSGQIISASSFGPF
jgi:hypothetical protein